VLLRKYFSRGGYRPQDHQFQLQQSKLMTLKHILFVEKVRMMAGDKVLPASCRKIKLNNNTICDSEGEKAAWHGTALGQC
jgi:hypothetical protein